MRQFIQMIIISLCRNRTCRSTSVLQLLKVTDRALVVVWRSVSWRRLSPVVEARLSVSGLCGAVAATVTTTSRMLIIFSKLPVRMRRHDNVESSSRCSTSFIADADASTVAVAVLGAASQPITSHTCPVSYAPCTINIHIITSTLFHTRNMITHTHTHACTYTYRNAWPNILYHPYTTNSTIESARLISGTD